MSGSVDDSRYVDEIMRSSIIAGTIAEEQGIAVAP